MKFHSPGRLIFWALGIALLSEAISLSRAIASDPLTENVIRRRQEALIWTTDYEGLIDGKVGDGMIAAIGKFQTRSGKLATGTLSDDEAVELIKEGYARRDAAGFTQVTDKAAGVSVGIPLKWFQEKAKDTIWGLSWYDKSAQLAIDTLRFKGDVSLRDMYDRLLTINGRTVAYSRFVENSWFVISAFEKGAAVYVRANLVSMPDRPDEIRGFSIWMGPDRPPGYQSLAPAMLSSFRSNIDTSHDVLIAPMGGVSAPIPKSTPRTPTISIKPISTPSNPDQPIFVENAPRATGRICYFGVGDCPRSIYLSFGR